MKLISLCKAFCTMHFALCILLAQSVSAVDINTYYASLNGKSGKALFDAVHTVANEGFNQLSYNDLWVAYQTTDAYPADSTDKSGMVWDMYSDCSFDFETDRDRGSGGTSECQKYNREHSIPKSWFCDCTSGMGADLFHLYPTDKKVNNQRSNYAYGEVNNATYTSGNGSKMGAGATIQIKNTVLGPNYTTSSTPGTVFEPVDVYKGDFARGFLGTMTKWTTSYQMNDGDGAWFFNNNYTEAGHFGLTPYGIALLMKWHREDAVSRKEIDRNNGIQATQGNRNPFIDLPELAEYIWGRYAGQTYNLPDSVSPVEQTRDADRGERKLINGKLVITLHGRSYNAQGLRY